jgi:hypothetical protein
VKSVLVEIGQVLASFRGKFAVIGGSVPWLLLENADNPHVGTLDVDLSLDAEVLQDGQYADLIHELMGQGYDKTKNTREFQLQRTVPATDGGSAIEILVDFLMPKHADIEKNRPKLIENFRVQRADGADLAVHFHQLVAVSAKTPTGGQNTVEIAVCSIPALLAMKGYAVELRQKRKDAYDIHYCIRNYPGGAGELAEDCRKLLEHESARTGYEFINAKFETVESYGPTSVRLFVEESAVLGDQTPQQWQQDAYGQVNEWLIALGLRKPQ